jgi:uncharacterized protein (DUF433 family)
MQIEEYFTFLSDNDIRIQGSRIGIETVLYEFIHRGQTPENIVESYPNLSLEQVYATILYYLHNQEKIGKYVADWLEQQNQKWQDQEVNPHAGIIRLRQLVTQYGRDPLVYQKLRQENKTI